MFVSLFTIWSGTGNTRHLSDLIAGSWPYSSDFLSWFEVSMSPYLLVVSSVPDRIDPTSLEEAQKQKTPFCPVYI